MTGLTRGHERGRFPGLPRRFVHRRHSIYYRPAGNGIFVVRVLGPGMSPDRNLP